MITPDLSTLDAAETLLKESVPVRCGEEAAADWRSHLEATLRGVVRSVCRLSEEVSEVRQKLVFCERSVVALTAAVSSGGGGGGGGGASAAHHRHESDGNNYNYLPKLQEMQALLAGHSRIIAGLDRSLVDARAATATATALPSPQRQPQQQPLPRLAASEPSPQRESKYFAPHQDPVPPKLYSSAQSGGGGGGGGDGDAPAMDGGGVPRTRLSQVRGTSPSSAAVGRQAAEPIGVPASTPSGRAQTPHRRAQQQQQPPPQQWSSGAFFSTASAAGRPGVLRTPPSRSSAAAAAAAAAADPPTSVSWGVAPSWQGRTGGGACMRGGSPEMF